MAAVSRSRLPSGTSNSRRMDYRMVSPPLWAGLRPVPQGPTEGLLFRVLMVELRNALCCRSSLFRRRCLLVSCSRIVAPREQNADQWFSAAGGRKNQWGQSPQPGHLPNGKSKLGQLNTVRWQHEATGDRPDHWPQRLSGSALSRPTFFRRNERNPTGTFPRSSSSTWSCFFDRQSGCSGQVPWEPSGAVPFIWCPSFDFPF